MSDRLGRADHLGNTAQFGFIQDAEGLHQSGSQHVWRFVFGKDEELFDGNSQAQGDQFKRIKAWKVNAALKPGQMAGSNLHALGQLLLGKVSLLAKFLDASS